MNFDDFMLCISKRVEMKRQNCDLPLSLVTKSIVSYWCEDDNHELIKDIIDQHVHDILNDCEIYEGMEREKAVDALRECSGLAVMYIGDNVVYERITRMVKELMSSYP